MHLLSRSERTLQRELSAAAMIPLTAHVDAHVARTRAGDYVQTLRLGGISFESADDEDINNWHERLNVLLRNIASPHLALWTHVVRRRELGYPTGRTVPGFAGEVEQRYRQKMAGQRLMVNELYLSTVFRPQSTRVGNAALRLLKRTDSEGERAELRDSLDLCDKLRQELLVALERYDPQPLGIYQPEDSGSLCSSLAEFYGLLINGEWQRMPLTRAPLDEVLATTRPFFGHEAMEYRTGTQTRIGAFLGIKEYPTPTAPGMFDALLTAPFPFVLTQSFTFLAKGSATDMMSRQYRRMAAAGDLALSQAEELKEALDDLASNRFVAGDHHFSLHVLADVEDGVGGRVHQPRLKQLNDHMARARYLLGDTGMVVAREDLALEAAFWAQLPGNFGYRSRKAPITSRNFAAMSPFHNFPHGPRDRQLLGQRADDVHDPRGVSLLFLAARERPAQSRWRQPTRRGTPHRRGSSWYGQDHPAGFLHGGHLQSPGCHPDHLRQGRGPAHPGAGTRRPVPAHPERRADGLQSPATRRLDARQRRIHAALAAPPGLAHARRQPDGAPGG
ncbi:hypothetical protein [Variovorax sp. efr-133-TYG-130]|uniref:VirB4 family type IV secretion/conjugal transfer ATPase n=1 Tax=Variovorax sp. efr-133-TYG-130 TaxID=3040327 RepID=UPI00255385D0|nr:hypothetical protein [Variovorax sp. efr-133-TYG-130]